MGQGTSAKGLGQQSGGLTAHRGGGGKEEDLAGLRASVRTGTCPHEVGALGGAEQARTSWHLWRRCLGRRGE